MEFQAYRHTLPDVVLLCVIPQVHCSTGQKCDNILDPRTGEPINFNFLPTYAHPGMGVFPHTVQVYFVL
jgi:hypothetical protein